MNAPPSIVTGPGSPELCARAHAALAEGKAQGKALKAIAADFGVARSTLRNYAHSHTHMRTWSVQLVRDGMKPMPVCQVTTPKGALAAALAAYREYPGTLKSLELPGWVLLVDDHRFELEAIREELATSRRAAA